MAEFVAHEIQVAVAGGSGRDQADEFVQGDTPFHHIVLRTLVHAEVHFLVHEAEDDGLVAHQRLVMAFGIGDGLFLRALAREFPPHFAHGPLFVAAFLDPLDPVVGHAHAHAEVEAHAEGLEGGCQARHGRYILGDGDAVGIHLFHQLGGQGQVNHGVFVHAAVEVQAVIAEILAQTVVPVQHGGNAVEAETVDVVFLHPVFHIGQQVIAGFVLAVVEAAGAPGRMVALRAAVEVEIIRAVEFGQAFQGVLHAVAVHDVHDHGNAFTVGVVHQGLELLGRAETGAQRKEITYLIAERAVIRVLLQRHDLDGVVAQFFHARQHLFAEFLEGTHLLLFRRHADMAFVDERMGPLAGVAVLPDKLLGRSPHLGAEHFGHFVLHYAGGIGGQALSPAAGPFDVQFVQLAVPEEHFRNLQFPVAVPQGLEGIAVRALPVVEIADEEDLVGIGGKLPEHPAAIGALVQAVIHVVVHGILQQAVAGNVP